jgi:hypothetical protein
MTFMGDLVVLREVILLAVRPRLHVVWALIGCLRFFLVGRLWVLRVALQQSVFVVIRLFLVGRLMRLGGVGRMRGIGGMRLLSGRLKIMLGLILLLLGFLGLCRRGILVCLLLGLLRVIWVLFRSRRSGQPLLFHQKQQKQAPMIFSLNFALLNLRILM